MFRRAPIRSDHLRSAVAHLTTTKRLEQCLGMKAQKNLLPLQLGDVPDTYADVEDLVRDVGYLTSKPSTKAGLALASSGLASA